MSHNDSRSGTDIDNRFTYHPPTPERVKAHEVIRAAHKNLALLIANYVPPGREHSLALTNLEQSMFWANAAIARGAQQ